MEIEVAIISTPQLIGNEPDDSVAPKRTRDYGWLAGVWVLVGSFALVTALWSRHVGIPVRDPGGTIFSGRATASLVWFGVLVLIDASVRAGRRGWTIGNAAAELRRRWTKERLALALSGLLAYHLVYWCYRNLKSWNALNDVRDDTFLRVDKWLFLGHSPAVLLQDVLGRDVAAHVLAPIYASFTYLVPLSFVAALVFANQIRDGYVFLTSSLWVWILGVASYYLVPSLGPFASAPQNFVGLSHTRIATTQTRNLTDRAHLLEQPAAADAFNSVNAFASLHVGFTFMVLLMMRYYGFRRATVAMTVYLLAVMIATVYFGWHFTVDDVAGLALAFLAVLFGRLMIYPRGRPSA